MLTIHMVSSVTATSELSHSGQQRSFWFSVMGCSGCADVVAALLNANLSIKDLRADVNLWAAWSARCCFSQAVVTKRGNAHTTASRHVIRQLLLIAHVLSFLARMGWNLHSSQYRVLMVVMTFAPALGYRARADGRALAALF